MQEVILEIVENKEIHPDIYQLILQGNCRGIEKYGQFVNITLDSFYLRRPFSIAWYTPTEICIIYKVLGSGTKAMTKYEAGKKLNLLLGLGNGFNYNSEVLSPKISNIYLVGGGIGLPPLIGLGEELKKTGKNIHFLLGFQNANSVFGLDILASKNLAYTLFTDDGSRGRKGYIADYLKTENEEFFRKSYFYACGPTGMLKSLERIPLLKGQFSYEARMACGFGACMGCACENNGKKGVGLICKDGPVFEKGFLK